MRSLSFLLALGVTVGAVAAIRAGAKREPLDVLANAALQQSPPDSAGAVQLYAQALRDDPANPYRWTDLGAALQIAGDQANARRCYARALELSGQIPQIWLRQAVFHIQARQDAVALQAAGKVLRLVRDYDDVLFGYFDRLGWTTNSILSEIGEDRQAMAAYERHLMAARNTSAAKKVWSQAESKGFVDDALAVQYVDAMLRDRQDTDAWRDWIRYIGARGGDFPARNLLFNGGFENELTGSAFDWRITPASAVETGFDRSISHDGARSLRIRFNGTENVSYQNVVQNAVVSAGTYALQAWIKSDGLTTNEGPRLEVLAPESRSRLSVATGSFQGTIPWQLVTLGFTVPSGGEMVSVRIVRRPSEKIDSKIAGTLWIDGVRLSKQ